MPRNRQPPATTRGRSKEQLFTAETSDTSTDDPDARKSRGTNPKGERVEAPSAALLQQPNHDWGKIGVYVAVALAAITFIYSYADLMSLARNTSDDVKELKRKSDELLRSSLETSARIGVLERGDSHQRSPSSIKKSPQP